MSHSITHAGITHESVAKCIDAVKKANPLVHNITNYVVMPTVANALLAFGASPVMAHAEEEVEEIVSISSALALNIGTLSAPWVYSMKKALKKATDLGTPVILDPVGAGASRFRTETALELLAMGKQMLVRGNASEILTLAGENGSTKGVDSTADIASAVEAAQALALKYSCTVCASGKADIVTDGYTTVSITGGHALMPLVTGMGCTATGLAGAFAAVCQKKDQEEQKGCEWGVMALVATMVVMSSAGKIAGTKALGPGSFLPLFLDALYTVTEEDVSLCGIGTVKS